MFDFLAKEGVSPRILDQVRAFRGEYDVSEGVKDRIPAPAYMYYGKEIWEQAATALLAGENILLLGPKATGKNVLAEGLAALFGRPGWDVSFHVNTDAASLIGTDTFEGGQVKLRKGPVYRCAEEGGFGILDEINMAKNEALAVLHATLDFRRVIDVPGYERITLHPAARFIATMNYGYAGTPSSCSAPSFPRYGRNTPSSSPRCSTTSAESATAARSAPRPWTCAVCCPPCGWCKAV